MRKKIISSCYLGAPNILRKNSTKKRLFVSEAKVDFDNF